ncbi:TolC family protein [Volucribacter amazonae]|uniref:Adhesin transport system outer membrane protein n=1 Tax=Volucribacter amazonae TaxID=256731 RepID=A0A9X4SQV3_9PAST|nr:TolC family protein [Volucribacter amazonae]MDG6895796.1 hypothetical protein [Volucribacter amazonae]
MKLSSFTHLNKLLFCLPFLLFLPKGTTNETVLKDVIKRSLSQDPKVLLAQSEKMIAESQVEQEKSDHYPQISTFVQQNMHQYHRYSSTEASKFVPGAQLSLNLYSFGAIDKRVKEAKSKRLLSEFNIEQTQEEVAYRVTELYLMALSSSEQLEVLKQAHQRINQIIKDINVISDNDIGRQSELVQAQSRKYEVEQQMNAVQREIDSNINRLVRYAKRDLASKDIRDPFSKLNLQTLKQRYGTDKINPRIKSSEQQVEVAKAGIEASKASRLPKLDFVAQATRDDRVVYLNMSWDIYNRRNNYNVQENVERLVSAESELEDANLEIAEQKALSLINFEQYQKHVNILNQQIKSQKEVIDFYKLQFSIAKRTLLELLNAENELLSAQLSKVNSQYQVRHAVLDYLYAQGALKQWVDEK